MNNWKGKAPAGKINEASLNRIKYAGSWREGGYNTLQMTFAVKKFGEFGFQRKSGNCFAQLLNEGSPPHMYEATGHQVKAGFNLL